ncbi:zinc finger protein 532 isoform X1 [Salvelinus namaycush]|uniref:Zinc finger protein 532 n=2 Tax=Salvelinus namaycush TaxID=8040 RepID=A0A8U0QJE6_SALNM|nr:zinc finger protein 532 isoform X1 [Salvelinus namaycush]
MGDMKTPDFDDLLAAFDIPDMVDPKTAIESGHEDPHDGQLKHPSVPHEDPHDGQLKHPSVPHEDEAHTPSGAPDVGVSVIVKNVHKMDAGGEEHTRPEDVVQAEPTTMVNQNGLHNGYLSMSPNDRYSKNNGAEKTLRDVEAHHGLAISSNFISHSTFNQFSPISSAEEFDDDDKIEVDDSLDRVKQSALPFFRTNPLTEPPAKREEQLTTKAVLADSHSTAKPANKSNGDCDKSKLDKNNNKTLVTVSLNLYDSSKSRELEEEKAKETTAPRTQEGSGREAGEPCVQAVSTSLSQAKQANSSDKLSSCIAAIAALSAKKATVSDTTNSVVSESPPTTQRDSFTTIPDIHTQREAPKEAKERENPRDLVPEKPPDQESPSALEVARRLQCKQPEGPDSPTTSEDSSRGSGSPSSSPSTPVIPKVRIKTIKTSSGQIKRTVTRVLPLAQVESDPERLKRGSSIMVSSFLSSPNSTRTSSLPTTTPGGGPGVAIEINKQMTIKPVATAFLPVSAVKTAGSQVINLKLANNTMVKATVIPAASVQSASSAILKAANAIHQQQQQTVMVPVSSLANAKLTVPKTVHLTNLNLLPLTKTTSVSELHQVLSSSKPQGQQPVKQALLAAQAQKKGVSRVQVLASSQSSVVEAFNKVLSSINPVPVYVPNLSPPSAACISLPSRGYRCLECGDSFALERSLSQHYDRRSVRIEVTCNHCVKNLVFYNKCSLLSHARGHKDKGVVMQCSHLILKPIPTDQMIITSPPLSSATTAGSTYSSTGHYLGKGAGPQAQAAVICAPSNAPPVAAMPLDEDVSRLCRTSLKCLECSEMFLDENSLAMHYQQAPESSGQKTCTICQMLLPNVCSFASHQRIHQHKSPYICPECGAICRSIHFQSHVTRNCLHYTRRVGYRCVHCSVIYSDVAALKTHIQSSHCEIFYKCPICPMAFKSAPGTHSHARTQHPGVKIGEPKLIYKCSMCDTVFTQQTLLQSHFDQHIANQKVSVFKCPDCSMHYAQKQLMLDHIKTMHGTLKTIEGPPNLGINLPLSSSPNTNNNGLDREDKNAPSTPLKKAQITPTSAPQKPPAPGWTCGDCDRLFIQREVFVAHVRQEHGKQLKKHPCRQCDKSFSSSHSLCRHNRIKHKGLRKVYSCPHCPDPNRTFTKRVMLDKHIQLMHGGIKDAVGKMAPDPAHTEDSPPDKALSPKRKQQDDEGPPGPRSRGSTPTQPLKKLKVNVFKVHKCAVCSFTTEDLVTFHDHIPQHKSDGSSFQCRECGLCYTSPRSLARHLFIIHKQKEPRELARRNGTVAADENQRENQLGSGSGDGLDDGTPETKCKVCDKMFETEGSLNTHMRTHGMAFIRSKRLNATEK